MASYSQIKRKAEDAFAAVITSLADALADVTIYKGMDMSQITGTRVEVLCERATPEILADRITGNWRCEVELRIVAHYDDKTRAERTAMEDELFDICMRDDLAALLNNAGVANFYVYGEHDGGGESWEPGAIESGIVGTGERAESMTGTLYCRPVLTP